MTQLFTNRPQDPAISETKEKASETKFCLSNLETYLQHHKVWREASYSSAF